MVVVMNSVGCDGSETMRAAHPCELVVAAVRERTRRAQVAHPHCEMVLAVVVAATIQYNEERACVALFLIVCCCW